jgi:hypothetical protein
MGLRRLDPDEWIELDGNRDSELRLKDELFATRHDEVVAALPEATEASAELLEVLLAHLTTRWPELYRCDASGVHDLGTGLTTDLERLHPIEAAARLVQDDLCVMIRCGGGFVLGAAAVCFPSRWRLADKIGRSLARIHAPVPGYAESIGAPVDRFFAGISEDRPMWRLNWTLVDSPDLFLPYIASEDGGAGVLAPAVTDVGDVVRLRVERQTLRLLPRSGAVVFTIRTYVRSIRELVAGHPDLAASLAAILPTVPEANVAYRGWGRLRPALLDWLAAEGAGSSG